MKLLSTTIFGMIWLLPCSLHGQIVESPDRMTESDQQYEATIANRKKNISDSKKQEAEISLELVRLRLLIANEKVKRANSVSTKIDEPIFQKLESQEKSLDLKLTELRSYIAISEHTLYWPEFAKENAINEWSNDLNASGIAKEGISESESEAKPIIVKKNYQSFSEAYDLIIHPPKADCQIMNNDKEDAPENHSVFTVPQLLFSHTDPKLEYLFQKRDFITGHASLSLSSGGLKAFNLIISVATPKAAYLFGEIKQGEFIILKLLDGTEVRLQSQGTASGEWDVTTQSYHYFCQFWIGIREERLLKKGEVDKIVIKWSKVQDEYEIFKLDFFKNQFSCLENG